MFWISGIWKKNLTNKIVDFNPDNIIIPNDCLEHKFILKAAIIYKPLGVFEGFHSNNGHYTCWTRYEYGWLEISENICVYHKRIIEKWQIIFFFGKIGWKHDGYIIKQFIYSRESVGAKGLQFEQEILTLLN